MAKDSSQKFIARNRAPRVQIEYDVELYGAEKKIQLPFVMGVLADLSGKPADPLAAVADRKFLDIDVDNFDSRMKAIKPRVAFQVPYYSRWRHRPSRLQREPRRRARKTRHPRQDTSFVINIPGRIAWLTPNKSHRQLSLRD